jgi:hypothetical protein
MAGNERVGGWRLLEFDETIRDGDEYFDTATCDWESVAYSVGNHPLNHEPIRRRIPSPSAQGEDVLRALTRLFASGYLAGHNDTVEGHYVDVSYTDRAHYHRDTVTELLADSDYLALAVIDTKDDSHA